MQRSPRSPSWIKGWAPRRGTGKERIGVREEWGGEGWKKEKGGEGKCEGGK